MEKWLSFRKTKDVLKQWASDVATVLLEEIFPS
jgi:hypothetical protein